MQGRMECNLLLNSSRGGSLLFWRFGAFVELRDSALVLSSHSCEQTGYFLLCAADGDVAGAGGNRGVVIHCVVLRRIEQVRQGALGRGIGPTTAAAFKTLLLGFFFKHSTKSVVVVLVVW